MSRSYQEIEFVLSSDKIRFIHDGAGLPFGILIFFGPGKWQPCDLHLPNNSSQKISWNV